MLHVEARAFDNHYAWKTFHLQVTKKEEYELHLEVCFTWKLVVAAKWEVLTFYFSADVRDC